MKTAMVCAGNTYMHDDLPGNTNTVLDTRLQSVQPRVPGVATIYLDNKANEVL